MAIKNFLFGLLISSALILQSCSALQRRTDRGTPDTTTTSPSWPTTHEEEEHPGGTPTPPPPPTIPKVAIIFGPGGALTYGSIGFLQAIQKRRVPIHAVGGVEWGSMIAAFYSVKGSLNDVEWQLSKIKGSDIVNKSLVSGVQMNDVKVLNGFLKETIGKSRVEDAKVAFGCPAFNLNRNQTYMMNKGLFSQLLPYCLSYPPLFRPYNSNVSAIRDITLLANHLRAQGANYVVLVNVLGEPGVKRNITGQVDSAENIYWNEMAAFYSKPISGIDSVVHLDVEGFTVFDFDRKRDIILKGFNSSGAWVQNWTHRLGF